jgi:hypothetical protein
MAVELQNKRSGSFETTFAQDQAQGLANPNLTRVFEPESIHQLLDDLLGDFEENDSLVCL